MSAKKKTGPSYVAKKGNVEIPVYTIKRGQPNQHHAICYYEGGQRQRRYFSDLERAKKEAGVIATKISQADFEAIRLTGLDRQAYLEASDLLRPTGVSLLSAVREYVAAHQLLNGSPLLEAVRFYSEHREGQFTPMRVPDVVAELLEHKESKGRSAVYTKDLRYRLGRFSADLKDVNVHEAGTRRIENWLHRLKLSGRSMNNFLTAIRTLFTFSATRHSSSVTIGSSALRMSVDGTQRT
jgi:hypothetical protein